MAWVMMARRQTFRTIAAAVILHTTLIFLPGVLIAQSTAAKSIVRLDPTLDALVASDARVETLYTGAPGDSYEGPTWVHDAKPGYLLFTNVPGNVINKWSSDGKIMVFLDHIFTGDVSKAHRA